MRARRIFGLLTGGAYLLTAPFVSFPSAQSQRKLELSFKDGRVTLITEGVTAREILAEWSRKGNVQIVNLDKISGGPLSLQFTDTAEDLVLESLLGSAAGKMFAPRLTPLANAARFDRVHVLAKSTPTNTTPYVSPPPMAQPQMPPTLMQGSPDDEIPPVRPMPTDPTPPTTGFMGRPLISQPGTGVMTSPVPGVVIPVQGVQPGQVVPIPNNGRGGPAGTSPPTGRGRGGGGGGGQ